MRRIVHIFNSTNDAGLTHTEEQLYKELLEKYQRNTIKPEQVPELRRLQQMRASGEAAYGEGFSLQTHENPYSDPYHRGQWEHGRVKGLTHRKMKQAQGKGEVRTLTGQGRTQWRPPRGRDEVTKIPVHALRTGDIITQNGEKVVSARRGRVLLAKDGYQRLVWWNADTIIPVLRCEDDSYDYKSERGYIGKLINPKTGGIMARSEPFISANSAKAWLRENANEFIKSGKRVTGEIAMVFFDPERLNDTGTE
jgi:hypothetical protein